MLSKEMMFSDRVEAGKRLASALIDFIGEDAVVLAIPRGGVVVGYEVAQKLGLRLDITVPRKIGAPHNPELAIGAVSEDETPLLDQRLVEYLGVSKSYIDEECEKQRLEIHRRLKSYRGDAPPLNLKGRIVLIVDDGIATGATIRAALRSIRKKGPRSIVVAVPVAPPSTIRDLEKEADQVICLFTPASFFAIGQFYRDFQQTSDEEVQRLLRRNREKQK